VLLSEPINGMTVEGLLRHGFVHLQRVVPSDDAEADDSQGSDPSEPPGESDIAYIRFSKPLLRLLVSGLHKNMIPFCNAQSTIGQSLRKLLKTCRDYHGDTEEAAQLLSFVSACAAYVLLTPASRPRLESLADLRPGAKVFGDPAKLMEMARGIKTWAANVDNVTTAARETYKKALADFEKAANRAVAVGDVQSRRKLADCRYELVRCSAAYVEARHNAVKQQTQLKLCKRSSRIEDMVASGGATLTEAKTKGVDAWVLVGLLLYAMQCKGQETGTGAGRAGGDKTFQPKHTAKALTVFASWLDEAGTDDASVAALELLTTKRMTKDSKCRASQCAKPVVVVARDVLLQSLGMVFGGIAARCQKR
jgi:hypothetical protein